MTADCILLVGSNRGKYQQYLFALQKQYDVLTAISGKQAVELARQQPVRTIVLDAASMRSPGDRICRTFKRELPQLPVIHIHPGPRDPARTSADVVLYVPLSARRLVNSVGRLLDHDDEEVIGCGPITLNVPRRILISHGKETQLTPKAALLAEIFLRSPGQTIDRKSLMERVWQTDYMGDTRTLDVHIRLLRKAMESGGKPRMLQTVRGVGYRLEETSR